MPLSCLMLEFGGGNLGHGGQLAMTVCVLLVMLHPGQPPVVPPKEWQWPWGVKATAVSLCPGNLHSPPSKMGSSRNTRYRVREGTGWEGEDLALGLRRELALWLGERREVSECSLQAVLRLAKAPLLFRASSFYARLESHF